MQNNFFSSPIILVTGATGLVGGRVVEQLLAAGYRVRGLCRISPQEVALRLNRPNLEWVEGDVLDVLSLEKAMEGVSYVVHAAAMVSFAPRDRAAMYSINATGTANVVNVALGAGIQKLLFVSSIAALGRPNPRTLATDTPTLINEKQTWEESPLNSHYAKSKYLAEVEVWRGMAEGLPAVIVNPSVVLGEGDWHRSSTQLFKYVHDQNKYYTQGYINYVDVEDLGEVICRLLLSDLAGERYVVSAGYVSYKTLFEAMAKGFGTTPPQKPITQWLAEIVWRVEAVRSWLTGSRPLITRETAQTARTHFVYENQKIKEALSFQFRPLEETVERVCKALKIKYAS
ncbi:MAG: NAD-dependent epimerase/dehydratase family protein [Runella sp.]